MAFENINPSRGNQAITDARSYLDDKVAAVLSPFGTKGISGWVFDVATEDTLDLSSQITDHYTEDNSFINDHIVHDPIRVSLTGFVGELAYTPPPAVFGKFESLNNRLGEIPGYEPDFTDGMLQKANDVVTQAQDVVSQINNELDRAQNLAGAFTGDSQNATRQARLIQELRSLWRTAEVVSIQTPWAYYPSMVIESIRVVQDDSTESWSEVAVTCKEIRFAEVRRVTFDNDLTAPANQVQEAADEPEALGRAQTEDTPLRTLTTGGGL